MRIKEAVPELIVRDPERTIEFYTVHLGFEVTARVPDIGKTNWAELSNENVRLMIQAHSDVLQEMPSLHGREIGGTAILVLKLGRRQLVRDTYERVRKVTTMLMQLRDTEYDTTEFAIADPDGYIILLSGDEDVNEL